MDIQFLAVLHNTALGVRWAVPLRGAERVHKATCILRAVHLASAAEGNHDGWGARREGCGHGRYFHQLYVDRSVGCMPSARPCRAPNQLLAAWVACRDSLANLASVSTIELPERRPVASGSTPAPRLLGQPDDRVNDDRDNRFVV